MNDKYPILNYNEIKYLYERYFSIKFLVLTVFFFIFINYCILSRYVIIQEKKIIDLIINKNFKGSYIDYLNKTNIDFNNEFFQIREVQE